MRTITIFNYSKKPPKLLATVRLENSGQITITGEMKEQLQNGVFEQRSRQLIGPESGKNFMDAVLMEFKGAYIRAGEVR